MGVEVVTRTHSLGRNIRRNFSSSPVALILTYPTRFMGDTEENESGNANYLSTRSSIHVISVPEARGWNFIYWYCARTILLIVGHRQISFGGFDYNNQTIDTTLHKHLYVRLSIEISLG